MESTIMSGPIIRKYGFPNHDNIFGKRELEHGVDEPEENEPAAPAAPAAPKAEKAEKAGAKPAKAPSKSKKKS
jgi:hypothetical protein